MRRKRKTTKRGKRKEMMRQKEIGMTKLCNAHKGTQAMLIKVITTH